MKMNDAALGSGLRRVVGGSGFFALAFGSIVGSGWVVVLGDWLKSAGPGGTLVGFGLGAATTVLIALCYGELAGRFPRAGAEFLYVIEIFGFRAGFFVAWYLTLYAIAVCAFEGVALGWVLRTLWPGLDIATAYRFLGANVTWGALAVGVIGTLLISAVHYAGAQFAIRFQTFVTFGFILTSAVLIAIALSLGSTQNLRPMFPGAPGMKTNGILWIFATSAFFLNGWQTALHAIEERRATTTIGGAMGGTVGAILTAALFYSLLVVAAGSAVPWRELPRQDLPAVAAFRSLNGSLGTVLLVAAGVSLTKTWSAMVWVASRLVFAQARSGLLPAMFLRVAPGSGVPRAAVVAVALVTLLGILAGRGAVVPIVNMVSTCVALSIILCLVALLRIRRNGGAPSRFAVPGGTPTIIAALIGAIAMVGIALGKPLVDNPRTLPVEWALLLIWGAAGIGLRAAVLVRSLGKAARSEG
jgi:amino acid transporter